MPGSGVVIACDPGAGCGLLPGLHHHRPSAWWDHLGVMMAAVTIAMVVMVLASKP